MPTTCRLLAIDEEHRSNDDHDARNQRPLAVLDLPSGDADRALRANVAGNLAGSIPSAVAILSKFTLTVAQFRNEPIASAIPPTMPMIMGVEGAHATRSVSSIGDVPIPSPISSE